jgi:hypothetical protein
MYDPTFTSWPDIVGLLVAVVGIKIIDLDTGNRVDLLYWKAWRKEDPPPNWFDTKVSLELAACFGVLYP